MFYIFSLTGIGAICSFGVAAATICIIVLGSHRRNKHNQKFHFQIYNKQRIKQVVHHATKLNEAISSVRGVSVTRAHISFGAEHVKLPYLSAYLNSLDVNFRHGANFATGGSTIRKQNETIFENGISPFSLDIQIVQFDQFKERATQLYKEAKSLDMRSKLPRPGNFAKALYTFDIGQNDLSVGFRKLSLDQHRAALPNIVNQLASVVQHLYKGGGITFWIHNTGLIGCLPVQLFYLHNPPPGYLDKHGCVKAQNDIAVTFNRQLKDRVIKLRTELTEASIIYVDVYTAKLEMISNPKSHGKSRIHRFGIFARHPHMAGDMVIEYTRYLG